MYTLNDIKSCASFLKAKGMESPVAGIVLGTGLGALVKNIEVKVAVPYSDIPGFPEATVEFHQGNLLYGFLKKVPVVVMQGRFHYYEGYSMQQVTFPVRVMKELDVKYLLVSNAAGGLNPDYKKGDLVLLTDHINEQPENPLRGFNDPAFGNRFVDMSCPYDKNLNDKIVTAATRIPIAIQQGICRPKLGNKGRVPPLAKHGCRYGWYEYGTRSDCCQSYRVALCGRECNY